MPAEKMRAVFARARRYAQDGAPPNALAGALIFNVFFETSTRTRAAFEAAAKRLGAAVVHLDQATMSIRNKGETYTDTLRVIYAMQPRILVLRHPQGGAAELAASLAPPGVAVINGGDGRHQHPTQGLLDAYTLLEFFGAEDLSGRRLAIVGDILHSRVARSDIAAMKALGAAEVRAIAPEVLCPEQTAQELGVEVHRDMEDGLRDVDAVVLLRLQRERMESDAFCPSAADYFRDYGLTAARLRKMKSGAAVMHPGPINRGVEIEDEVADGEQSLILRQVENGVWIRMAVLTMAAEAVEGAGVGG